MAYVVVPSKIPLSHRELAALADGCDLHTYEQAGQAARACWPETSEELTELASRIQNLMGVQVLRAGGHFVARLAETQPRVDWREPDARAEPRHGPTIRRRTAPATFQRAVRRRARDHRPLA